MGKLEHPKNAICSSSLDVHIPFLDNLLLNKLITVFLNVDLILKIVAFERMFTCLV
jgi:hypothetical protein